MMLKTKLMAAGAALLLSAGSALAVPATAESNVNVRSGPGTDYPVVGALSAGESVDAGNCSGSWCQVRFGGGSGFVSRNYLAMGEGGVVAPGPAVAATPYVYDDGYYDDGFYDYGYSYGPSFGFYAGPRYRNGWRGRPGWNGGNWAGRGNWQGRGNWAGRPGSPAVGGMNRPGGNAMIGGGPRGGFAAGAGIGQGRMGAGASFRGGGGGMPGGGGGAIRSAPVSGGGGGAAIGGGIQGRGR